MHIQFTFYSVITRTYLTNLWVQYLSHLGIYICALLNAKKICVKQLQFSVLKGHSMLCYFYCMDVFSQVKFWHLCLHKITRAGDNRFSEIAQRSCLEGSQEERHHVVAKRAFWYQLLFLFRNGWEKAKDLATLWPFQYELKDDAKQMWTFLWKSILIS